MSQRLEITLEDLYLGFRKAKADAYYENSHFSALAFVEYEKNLNANLERLYDRLVKTPESWASNPSNIGSYLYAPKSVEIPLTPQRDRIFFRYLDPLEDWTRECRESGKRAPAAFRLMISPTVDFHIFAALWLTKSGHKFDAALPLCQCDVEQLPSAIYSLKVVSTHGSRTEFRDDQHFPGFGPGHP